MQSCTINGAAIFVPKPTLQSNNVLCGCLSPPMPSLPLPPDDDDGFLDLVPAVVPKAKVIARSRGKSGEGGKQKPVVLPPDDDEADSLFIPTASAPSTMKACRGRGRGRGRGGAPKVPVVKDIPNKIAKAKGKPNPKEPLNTPGIGSDYLPWHDERLKDSALQFESVVDMPYLDLHSLFFGRHPSPVSEDDRCDLWEIYSIPRLGPCIRELGGKSRRSYDIQHFWDLAKEDYKRLLIQDICVLRPKSIMLCPPCRMVSLLMASNWSRMKSSEKFLSLQEALSHLDMCMWLAKHQIHHKDYFAFEHPQGSLAWSRDSAP